MSAASGTALESACRGGGDGLRIEYLDAPVGARVHGLDATRPLTAGQLRALKAALHDRRVLLCYGQHLDEAQFLRFTRHVGDVLQPGGDSASLLYAEAVPRSGGDAVWINLAGACDLLDAGTKREIGALQLITYNPFLRRLRALPAGH